MVPELSQKESSIEKTRSRFACAYVVCMCVCVCVCECVSSREQRVGLNTNIISALDTKNNLFASNTTTQQKILLLNSVSYIFMHTFVLFN